MRQEYKYDLRERQVHDEFYPRGELIFCIKVNFFLVLIDIKGGK